MALYRGYRLGWLTIDDAALLESAESHVAYILERLHAPLGTRWTPHRETALAYAQGKRSEKWCNYWQGQFIDRYVLTGAVLELPEAAFSNDALAAARHAEREDARNRGYRDDGSYFFAGSVTIWPPSSAFLHIDGPSGPASFDVTGGLPAEIGDLERIVDNAQYSATDDWDYRCRRCRRKGARSTFSVEGMDPQCPACGGTEIASGEGWPWGHRSRRDWYHGRWMFSQDRTDLLAQYDDRDRDKVVALFELKAAALPDWRTEQGGQWLDIVKDVATELDIDRSVVQDWVMVRRLR